MPCRVKTPSRSSRPLRARRDRAADRPQARRARSVRRARARLDHPRPVDPDPRAEPRPPLRGRLPPPPQPGAQEPRACPQGRSRPRIAPPAFAPRLGPQALNADPQRSARAGVPIRPARGASHPSRKQPAGPAGRRPPRANSRPHSPRWPSSGSWSLSLSPSPNSKRPRSASRNDRSKLRDHHRSRLGLPALAPARGNRRYRRAQLRRAPPGRRLSSQPPLHSTAPSRSPCAPRPPFLVHQAVLAGGSEHAFTRSGSICSLDMDTDVPCSVTIETVREPCRDRDEPKWRQGICRVAVCRARVEPLWTSSGLARRGGRITLNSEDSDAGRVTSSGRWASPMHLATFLVMASLGLPTAAPAEGSRL